MGGGPTGVYHLPSPLQSFYVRLPNLDLNMTSYADDFALLASAPSIVEAEERANQLCTILVRWADGKQLAIAPKKSSVTLFTSDTHQSRPHPQVRIGDAVTPLNRSLKSWVSRWTHTSPSRPRLCRVGFEGPQYHESPSWVELGLHDRNVGGHIQGHLAPHPQICRPHRVHPYILNPPGQAWGDPEQGPEDCDRLPPKGRFVPPRSGDWDRPPERALGTMLPAVLC